MASADPHAPGSTPCSPRKTQNEIRFPHHPHFDPQAPPNQASLAATRVPKEVENQIAVDYQIFDRRPNDTGLLIPGDRGDQARLGRPPYLAAADGAFYSGKNEAAAKAKGVKRLRWVGLGVISDNLNSIVVNTANL